MFLPIMSIALLEKQLATLLDTKILSANISLPV